MVQESATGACTTTALTCPAIRLSALALQGLEHQYEKVTPPLCSVGIFGLYPPVGPGQKWAGTMWLINLVTSSHSAAQVKCFVYTSAASSALLS